jgi:hypothetical protein
MRFSNNISILVFVAFCYCNIQTSDGASRPEITRIEPSIIPWQGGQLITVHGTNYFFSEDMRIQVKVMINNLESALPVFQEHVLG